MVKITETTLNNTMRMDYLNSLPEFQELYLELFVENSEFFNIEVDNKTAGYAIKTADNILTEFYLENRFIPGCRDIFGAVTKNLGVERVYCKSFDFLLLNCCIVNACNYKLIGSLYRDCVDSGKIPLNGLSVRFAENNDYPFLLQQEDELYETPEELQKFVNGQNVLLFQKENELLGCGYLIKVHPQFNYYDIGMWVNPAHRKQGIGTMIISYLKHYCLENNWKPICGCAIENIASQKTLEKNGFVSKHKLIEFKVNAQA